MNTTPGPQHPHTLTHTRTPGNRAERPRVSPHTLHASARTRPGPRGSCTPGAPEIDSACPLVNLATGDLHPPEGPLHQTQRQLFWGVGKAPGNEPWLRRFSDSCDLQTLSALGNFQCKLQCAGCFLGASWGHLLGCTHTFTHTRPRPPRTHTHSRTPTHLRCFLMIQHILCSNEMSLQLRLCKVLKWIV